jgi:hypothetical protein
MRFFRKTAPECVPVARRSSLTIREALEAARQAGKQTPDTGLFERWLRAKGLSSRGSILIARMRQEYEQAFEERFSKGGDARGTVEVNHEGMTSIPSIPITVQPADPRKLNRLFLERQKGGDAKRRPTPTGTAFRNEGGSNPPSIPSPDSPDSIEALYASGKASCLKEALAILGGGR